MHQLCWMWWKPAEITPVWQVYQSSENISGYPHTHTHRTEYLFFRMLSFMAVKVMWNWHYSVNTARGCKPWSCSCSQESEQRTGYSWTTLSSDTGVSTGCCPAVTTDRKEKKSWQLKAFCLPRFPATFVPLHICQGRCPIAHCQAGKSAACHFWNDNWSLSQVCSQFVPFSHSPS